MPLRAYVLMDCEKMKAKDVVNELKSYKFKSGRIIEADALWGLYDVISLVEADDLDNLDDMVCHEIKNPEIFPSIVKTITCICKKPKAKK